MHWKSQIRLEIHVNLKTIHDELAIPFDNVFIGPKTI